MLQLRFSQTTAHVGRSCCCWSQSCDHRSLLRAKGIPRFAHLAASLHIRSYHCQHCLVASWQRNAPIANQLWVQWHARWAGLVRRIVPLVPNIHPTSQSLQQKQLISNNESPEWTRPKVSSTRKGTLEAAYASATWPFPTRRSGSGSQSTQPSCRLKSALYITLVSLSPLWNHLQDSKLCTDFWILPKSCTCSFHRSAVCRCLDDTGGNQ